MNLLFIGDVFGSPGRSLLKATLPELIEKYQVGLTIANGENAAGGAGLTGPVAQELFSMGVDVITSGHHIWDKKEIFQVIDDEQDPATCQLPSESLWQGSGVYMPRTARR